MLSFYKKSIYQFYKCLNAQFTHKSDFENSDATFALVWCLKQVKDLIPEFLISGSFFSENRLTYCCTIIFFFSFRCMCRLVYWFSSKLSRIQIWCSFPSMWYICSHKFHEWWTSLLDYNNKCIWCAHFKALSEINVTYILLNGMIKNQETVLYLDAPFINWGRISIYPNCFLFFSLPWMLSLISYNF